MTYNELLSQAEWSVKCREILQRDQYHCKNCGCLGYHDNSFYECDSSEELDKLLNGIRIDGDPVSVFVDKIRKLDSEGLRKMRRKSIGDDSIVKMNNKYLYDLKSARENKTFRIQTKFIPIACDCVLEEDCFFGSPIWYTKQPEVTCSGPIDWVFYYGDYSGYYIFEKDYFKKYVVRIEKRWPTGGSGDQYGTILFGHVVISIGYQNCCVALFFKDEACLDNDEHYHEIPITPKGLNIHHQYYIKGLKPWEYDNESLITLCQDCHMKEHQSKQVPIYRSYRSFVAKQSDGYAQICSRCGGSGYLPQYNHVEGGRCFKCNGEGVYIPDVF